MKLHSLVLASALCLSLSACMSTLSGDSYSREEARKVQTVEYGEIVALRPVVLEGTKTPIGTIAGAAIGGIAGSAVGQGKGADIAAVVGAVAGGIVGSTVEEAATRSQAVEITLRMARGETIAVVQAVSEQDDFKVGDKVRLLSSGGTSRVSR
ncbi:glycine zipper 2TM domain-containing protein [Niveibacterium sp. 24ML]|uniref:glycine zipper 2TM domain-containing protein n=1 Tax=Niveibacterium sp. 24ML TaxID=2985512 RepID=UPI002271E9B2|nr:glycine zipper 2TM domain-containing protein [Niveibacterium sp. 24ML]MCX9155716.1 glycine zipper 2TM domain-containing protein [Niveibacterium sp. 24ML]